MRTTLDLPDDLMRHLKARAALEGRSLRDLVLELVNRGLQAPVAMPSPAPLPVVRLGRPLALPAAMLTHADLSALAEE
ncbi:MAG: hypothetical protein Q8S02_11015 [Hydrogenophaga sp.]|nr:hypothetical protein [Hydrogenophaga sp.]